MTFKPSKDLWIVAILFLFTVVLVYLSSSQENVCLDPTSSQLSLWQMTSWPIKVVLLQLLLAFGLFAFSASRRVSAPTDLVEEPPRAQSEYVSSMANLVRKVGKSSLVVDTLSKQFRSELERKLGLNPDSSHDEILNALRVQHPQHEPRVREIFRDEIDLQSSSGARRTTDLLEWAQNIADARRQWRGAN